MSCRPIRLIAILIPALVARAAGGEARYRDLRAYIAPTPSVTIDAPGGKVQASELRLENTSAKTDRLLLRGHADEDPRRMIAAMRDPMFSPDGRHIYFSGEAWVVSGAVRRIRIESRQVDFIVDGDLLGLVRSGRHAGRLIVERFLIKQNAKGESLGRSPFVWVVSPDGKSSFEIGASDSPAAMKFLRDQLPDQARPTANPSAYARS